MGKRNYRKRRNSEGQDDNDEVNSSEAIEERKELQKFRERPRGVSAVGLALGKKLAPDEEVVSDPFKLKTGGLVDLNDLIQDRNRDRDGENEKSIVLGANFAAETNQRDEDTHMLKYIEDEMAKRKGNQDGDQKLGQKKKSKEDSLYELPKYLDVHSKIMRSEEMLSNQMLSGIPEVDLGIDAKIRNIEATEEAKQKLLEDQMKKRNEPTDMVPTNMASNFMLHSRFFDEQKSIEAETKKAAAAAKLKAQEDEKSSEPKVSSESFGLLTGDQAVPGAVAVSVPGQKRTSDKIEKATDDFFYEKFRKRARDSWRYQ